MLMQNVIWSGNKKGKHGQGKAGVKQSKGKYFLQDKW